MKTLADNSVFKVRVCIADFINFQHSSIKLNYGYKRYIKKGSQD